MMNYDEAINEVGNLRNRYQMWLFFVLMFTCFRSDPVTLMFVLMKPNYTCDWASSMASQNLSLNLLADVPITMDSSNNTVEEKCSFKLANNQTIKCTNWIFENNNSAISELSLICDKGGWPNAMHSSIWIGNFISVFAGPPFEKLGRRKAFIGTNVLQVIASLVAAFAVNNWMLYISMFVKGFCITAYYIPLIIMMELSNIKSRVIVGNGCWSMNVLFHGFMPLLAYVVPYWRNMLYILAAKEVLILIVAFSMPESPRWQVITKRTKEAQKTMDWLCKMNKVPKVDINKIEVTEEEGFSLRYFKYKKIVIRMVGVIFWWSAVSLIYFGITLNLNFAMDNPYVAQSLMGFSEVFCIPLAIGMVWKLGNKIPIYINGLSTTIGIFAVYFFSDFVAVRLIFALLGKIAASTAFVVVIIFTGETFSTDVRTTGQFTAWMSCLTTASVTYINSAAKNYPFIPTLIYGIFGIFLVVTVIPFPETKGYPLCQHMSELPPVRWQNIREFRNRKKKPNDDSTKDENVNNQLLL